MKAFAATLLIWLFQSLSMLPLSLLQFKGRQLGRLMWRLHTESRRVTEENLLICFPELSAFDRARLAKRRLLHLGMTALESPYVWRRPQSAIVAVVQDIQGKELIDGLMAEGKGVILLAPHIGNWELLGIQLSIYYPSTFMYQPPDNPALDQLIYNARKRGGAKLAPTNLAGVKALIKALKAGELVGVLPDQVPPRGTGGEFAPFFKIPALTSTLCFNLQQRTGARVVISYAERLENGRFRLHFKQAHADIYSADQQLALAALNHSVEQCARAIPEQYQWEYKRFRKQPDGVRRYYLKHSSLAADDNNPHQ